MSVEEVLSDNALNLLEQRYLDRDENGEVCETPEELFERVAKNIASAEKDEENREFYEDKFYDVMTSLKFLPNSPTLMNAGLELQQLAACFVLPVEDSMEGIFDAIKNAALIHKSGGGTGFTFQNLRPEGDIVQSTGGVSSGPISFMKVFNQATNTVKQGGKRRGANMGMISVHHPDVLDFIECKGKLNKDNEELFELIKQNVNDEEKLNNIKRELLDGQISNFNISIAVTDDFMDAVENNKRYEIVNPRTNEKVDELDANRVFDKIANFAHQDGEPGLVYIDKINRDHPVNKDIEATNPCGEQPLLPYEACNLGSLNLPEFLVKYQGEYEIDWSMLEYVTKLAVRFLDNVISVNNYPLQEIEDTVKKYRKVGLGVMGFHELLIKLGVRYDSNEAVAVAEKVMKFINRTAHEYSTEIAKEKGSFPAIDESEYNSPKRNATLTTIAPTGSISFIGGTSGGIEPFFSFQYSHTDADGNVSMFNYDFTDEADGEVLITTQDISPKWHIKIQAAFQAYVDNAVSKTINMPNDTTVEDVKEAYKLSYRAGCKGLTIYRDGSRNSQVLENSADDDEDNADNENTSDTKDDDRVQSDDTETVQKNEQEVIDDIKRGIEKAKPNTEKNMAPQDRPNDLSGDTYKYETGCGKLYLTVNRDDNGKPVETLMNTGSDGGCIVMTEAMSRLISLALRSGVDISEVIDQLKSTNTCSSFMYDKGKGKNLKGRSCPDLVGRVLEEAQNNYENNKCEEPIINDLVDAATFNIDEVYEFKTCPECSSEMMPTEGCSTCPSCGYSDCS